MLVSLNLGFTVTPGLGTDTQTSTPSTVPSPWRRGAWFPEDQPGEGTFWALGAGRTGMRDVDEQSPHPAGGSVRLLCLGPATHTGTPVHPQLLRHWGLGLWGGAEEGVPQRSHRGPRLL